MTIGEKLEASKNGLDALLTYANGVTGAADTNIGDAVKTLADGFGGSSPLVELAGVGEVVEDAYVDAGMIKPYSGWSVSKSYVLPNGARNIFILLNTPAQSTMSNTYTAVYNANGVYIGKTVGSITGRVGAFGAGDSMQDVSSIRLSGLSATINAIAKVYAI